MALLSVVCCWRRKYRRALIALARPKLVEIRRSVHSGFTRLDEDVALHIFVYL